ncbi:MAG: glycolate oxidase subunit GlcF [Gammaproteobacteria bacterium]|nr:glycolate oxidase subunit GlcF [Gammaproteobacteria bacterium]
MRTELPATFLATEDGRRANAILRSCVHCGFCNATCPTYQVTGDELDGPRGRIYLMKSMFESGEISGVVREHLDRCLTCRSCETTCPSGVRYSELLEIGRSRIEKDAPRPLAKSLMRKLLGAVLPAKGLLTVLLRLGRPLRPLFPRKFRHYLAPVSAHAPQPRTQHARKVLLLNGCVQRQLTPQVNDHLVALLNARGVTVIEVADEACCGGLNLHLGQDDAAHASMTRNIKALTPYLGEVEAIISTASGCGVTLKDYGRLYPAEGPLAAQAQAIAAKTVDAVELLAHFEFKPAVQARRIAVQTPCTLQHGQKLNGRMEVLLERCGYDLLPVAEPHLCCGSAGTYSILEPEISDQLRTRKLAALHKHQPEVIATANIGCQMHLAAGTSTPVLHWLTLLE